MKAILVGLREAFRSGKRAWRIDGLGRGPTLEEAGSTDELSAHVPLTEGSRFAKASRTEFYDDLTGFEFYADMVCRAREQEMKFLVAV